jgi:hypothetical protein
MGRGQGRKLLCIEHLEYNEFSFVFSVVWFKIQSFNPMKKELVSLISQVRKMRFNED